MDYSTTEINSLGVTVTKVGNKLETDLYCQPTDTHQYLHAKPSLNNVYKGSIAYGQVVRFKRICSTEEKLNNHLEQLKQRLVKRGYRKDHVESETERINWYRELFRFKYETKTLMKTFLSSEEPINMS